MFILTIIVLGFISIFLIQILFSILTNKYKINSESPFEIENSLKSKGIKRIALKRIRTVNTVYGTLRSTTRTIPIDSPMPEPNNITEINDILILYYPTKLVEYKILSVPYSKESKEVLVKLVENY